MQSRESEREQRQRMEEQRRERIENPVHTAPVKPAPPVADSAAFAVREFRFEPPSDILSAQELQALAAPFLGPAVTLRRLRELVDQVNALYQSKGVVTAQVSLPPQDVTEGVVRLRVIEGRVGQVRIDGNASTNAEFITQRLSLQPHALVDLPLLESELLRFNRSNDAQLRVDLKPGVELGRTDIALTVVEPKRDDVRVFGDNAGSSATGVARVGTSYTRKSLTGQRDDLFLSLVHSEGNTGRTLSYGMPINRQGTRATLSYFNDDTKIVAGPIAGLDVTGQATAWSLAVRHPAVVAADRQIDALATLKQRHTGNWASGALLTAADLVSVNFGVDAQYLDAQGNLNVTAELTSGNNHPDGSDARDFTVARGAVRGNYSLSSVWSTSASFSWQYAELNLLPSSEQFQIGGEGSVRGYEPGVYSGDQGWAINLELQRRVDWGADSGWSGAVLAFVDQAQVQPYRPPNNPRGVDTLTSAGIGVVWSLKDKAQWRLTVGQPLNPPADVSDATRVHFQATWYLM